MKLCQTKLLAKAVCNAVTLHASIQIRTSGAYLGNYSLSGFTSAFML